MNRTYSNLLIGCFGTTFLLCIASAGDLSELTNLAESGDVKAQRQLGLAYLQDDETAVNPDESVYWLAQAADAGDPIARAKLGFVYWHGEVIEADQDRARVLLLQAAGQGVALAQTHIGWMYETGARVAQDLDEAVQWHSLAAVQGNVFALMSLSRMYQTGHGVEKNEEFADLLLRKAAHRGDRDAMFRAGIRDIESKSPELELRGEIFLRYASNLEHSPSKAALVVLYESGRGTPQGPELLPKLISEINDEADVAAMQVLAGIYYSGSLGIEQDHLTSARWFERALENDHDAVTNSYAWMLATSNQDDARDGVRAVELMERYLSKTGSRAPHLLDTMAAAHAESGDFAAAADVQRQAIAALDANMSTAVRQGFLDRLSLFESGQPYRE